MRNAATAKGKFRANDPWYRLKGNLLVRRLSPNNRKLEAEGRQLDCSRLTCCSTMGLELANVHLGTGNRRERHPARPRPPQGRLAARQRQARRRRRRARLRGLEGGLGIIHRH